MTKKTKSKSSDEKPLGQLAKETLSSVARGTLEGVKLFGDTTAEGFRAINNAGKKK